MCDVTSMTKEQLTKKLKCAIEKLYSEHKFLLQIKGSERAVAHHLANYLKCEFSRGINIQEPNCCDNSGLSDFEQNNLIIDCEYNRQLQDPKRDQNDNLIIPDIVLHKRGCNCKNILAIELKLHASSECFRGYGNNMLKDMDTLYSLKDHYNYKYTVCIGLPKTVESTVERDVKYITFDDVADGISKKFSGDNQKLFECVKGQSKSNPNKVVLLIDEN